MARVFHCVAADGVNDRICMLVELALKTCAHLFNAARIISAATGEIGEEHACRIIDTRQDLLCGDRNAPVVVFSCCSKRIGHVGSIGFQHASERGRGLFDACRKIRARGVQLHQVLVARLIKSCQHLGTGYFNPIRKPSGRRFIIAHDLVGCLVHINRKIRIGLGNPVDEFSGDILQSQGDNAAAVFNPLGRIDTGFFDQAGNFTGCNLEMIGDVFTHGADGLLQFTRGIANVACRCGAKALNGVANFHIRRIQLISTLMQQLHQVHFHAFDFATELD